MKIAAIHSKSIIGDLDFNLQETSRWLKKLSGDGVKFALFPELNLSGYTKNEEVLKSIYSRRIEVFKVLKKISSQLKIGFAVGFPELVGNQLMVSQFLFHGGKQVGVHRKTHLGPTEKSTFLEGNSIDLFSIDDLNVGMQICFESHFPEISAIQAQKGANLLTFSFASPREKAVEKLERFKRFLCARAYDNSCYALVCNQTGTTDSGKKIPGISMIIDPKGKVLSESIVEGGGYCIADFEPSIIDRIRNSKMAWYNKHKRIHFLNRF